MALSMARMRRRGLVVERATVTEFRVPASGQSRTRCLVVQLAARLPDRMPSRTSRVLIGNGECTYAVDEPDQLPWQPFRSAVERLHGFEFNSRPSLSEVARVVAMEEAVAGASAGGARSADSSRGIRSMASAVEMALVDLAAQVANLSLAEFLGGRRRPIQVACGRAASATGSDDELRRHVARARSPIVRFNDVDSCDTMQRLATLVAKEPGPPRSVWLDLCEGIEFAEIRQIVDGLAERILADELAPHVVLQPSRDGAPELAELQEYADRRVSPGPDRPGTVVMAGPEVRSVEHAKECAAAGIRGSCLNPAQLGGLLAARYIARELFAVCPHVRVGLTTTPRASHITGRALAELAGALPRVDYFAVAPMQLAPQVKIDPPLKLDRERMMSTGSGPGLGATVDLSPAVHRVTRGVDASTNAQRGSNRDHPANTYDADRLKGLFFTSHLLERAALMRGLNTMRLSEKLFVATHEDLAEPLGFLYGEGGWTGAPSNHVSEDKAMTSALLRESGVMTPDGDTFTAGQVDEAVAFARSLNTPVVVKPRAGGKGKGVSTDLRTEHDVRKAIKALDATKYAGEDFMVERFVTGNDYRFFVAGSRVLSVVMRRPASVVGDGRLTVADLVVRKNLTKLTNPHMRTRLIKLGINAMTWLDRQGLTPLSVPEDGQTVRLSGAANGSLGADTIEVLDETHPTLLALAIRATRAIPGIDHAGIDLIGHHQRAVDEQSAAVLEVNANPGYGLHLFPLFGPARDVAGEVVGRSCDLAKYPRNSLQGNLSVRLEIDCGHGDSSYLEWFTRVAAAHRLVGSVRAETDGRLVAMVSGSADDISLVAARAIKGSADFRVDRVMTTHVPAGEPIDRLEVR